MWDEWLIRVNAAIAVGLGQTSQQMAQAQIEAGDTNMPLTPDTDIKGPYQGRGNDNEWGVKHADILHRLVQADFAVVLDVYDRACHLSLLGGQDVYGWRALDTFWMALRSAFRWSLTGTHDGWGAFGPPTGAKLHVMGVSHVEFGPRGIRRETTLYDEIAIWKQILLQSVRNT